MSATGAAHTYPASHEFRIYGPLSAVTGAMFREYDRAKDKHGDQTPDGSCLPKHLNYIDDASDHRLKEFARAYGDMRRLATITEELGEVARCLTYDQDHAGSLRKELIQVAAMALAWASRLEK